MPYYMIQATYTPATMAAMIQSPHDRPAQFRAMVEKLGGKLEGFWLAFGEYDVLALCEMPDSETMAALSMAISAEGSFKTIKTTTLITWDESLHAMNRAAESIYTPYGTPRSMD